MGGYWLNAVVQLDAVLGVPDFRSEERAYQLLISSDFAPVLLGKTALAT